MTALFIDCCIRGEKSATRRYTEAWMAKYVTDNVETIRLAEIGIKPLLKADIMHRDAFLAEGKTDDAMFRFARQFKEADEIIIAAPFWDLSFPSLLKVYFENVSVCGITFGYEGDKSVGYARAKKVHYFATCGGFPGNENEATRYVRAICEMFGIENFEAHLIEGMDIDCTKREEMLAKAIANL